MKKYLRIIGLLLGGFFLIWSLSQINAKAFFYSLSSLNTFWILVGLSTIAISIFIRSVRWHTLTGLSLKDLPRVWESTCVGCFGNSIYPARMGDIMRMFHLQKRTDINGGVALGSNVIDRILEGLGLCFLLLIVVLGEKVLVGTGSGLFYIAFAFLLATGVVIVFITSGHHLQSLFAQIAKLGKVGVSLNRWYEQSLSGLQILRSPKRLVFAAFLQVVVSALDILTCWFLILSFGWDIPLMASVVTLVYIAAATSLPSSPGYIGVYQIATLFALRPYGIEESSAVAFGTVLQLGNLVVFLCLGILAYMKDHSALHKVPQV